MWLSANPCFGASDLPLLFDPDAVFQGGLIRGGVVTRHSESCHQLLGQRGLAGLSGTDQHLQKTSGFCQTLAEHGIHGPGEHGLSLALCIAQRAE